MTIAVLLTLPSNTHLVSINKAGVCEYVVPHWWELWHASWRSGAVAQCLGWQRGTFLTMGVEAQGDGEELCQLVLIRLLKLSPPVNCCYTCSVEPKGFHQRSPICHADVLPLNFISSTRPSHTYQDQENHLDIYVLKRLSDPKPHHCLKNTVAKMEPILKCFNLHTFNINVSVQTFDPK